MFFDDFNWNEIKTRSIRQNISQFVLAMYAVIGSYMIWKLFCIFLENDSPIVCVLSESMEPGFKRGDILFLKPQEFKPGDVAVFQIYENSIPIVHRVIKKIGNRLLTKGDNNNRDDVGLYRRGKKLLETHEMRAGVFGYIPFFGMITIWISSIPGLKNAIMAYTLFSVFSRREDTRGTSHGL